MSRPPANDEQISRFEFETQATSFDGRASLGPEVARAVARAIFERLALVDPDPLLEIGAGTGEIGVELASRTRGYIGIDGSQAMLDRFRARADPSAPMLRVADANQAWPVADASIRCVFLSRVLHLLNRDHVRDEVLRVAHPGGLGVIVGRRVRDADAPAARLRLKLRSILHDLGYQPRNPQEDGAALVESLRSSGATPIALEAVARRTLRTSYRIELDAWRFKGGIAGLSLPAEVREIVLSDLERWALAEVGALEAPVDAGESYVIEGALVGPPPS